MYRPVLTVLSLTVALLPSSMEAQDTELTPDEGTRRVLEALTVTAEANAKASDKEKKQGDELCELLVRSAAAEAAKLPEKIAGRSFLQAVGVGLDDSNAVLALPIFGSRIERFESSDLRKRRLAALGQPTMRKRRDLCQHFAVSVSLTELLGAPAAELAGISKELKDSIGESGFSFDDIQADLAGIAFSQNVAKGKVIEKLSYLAKYFRVTRFLPEHKGLPTGLKAEAFREQYGNVDDDRFKKQLESIRKTVDDQYRGKEKKEE